MPYAMEATKFSTRPEILPRPVYILKFSTPSGYHRTDTFRRELAAWYGSPTTAVFLPISVRDAGR
eukprot:SAG31_NODE_3208_length_4552_cov_5.626993_3_plen_65_part_00